MQAATRCIARAATPLLPVHACDLLRGAAARPGPGTGVPVHEGSSAHGGKGAALGLITPPAACTPNAFGGIFPRGTRRTEWARRPGLLPPGTACAAWVGRERGCPVAAGKRKRGGQGRRGGKVTAGKWISRPAVGLALGAGARLGPLPHPSLPPRHPNPHPAGAAAASVLFPPRTCGNTSTTVSKFGSMKKAAEKRSRPVVFTTRCTVLR